MKNIFIFFLIITYSKLSIAQVINSTPRIVGKGDPNTFLPIIDTRVNGSQYIDTTTYDIWNYKGISVGWEKEEHVNIRNDENILGVKTFRPSGYNMFKVGNHDWFNFDYKGGYASLHWFSKFNNSGDLISTDLGRALEFKGISNGFAFNIYENEGDDQPVGLKHDAFTIYRDRLLHLGNKIKHYNSALTWVLFGDSFSNSVTGDWPQYAISEMGMDYSNVTSHAVGGNNIISQVDTLTNLLGSNPTYFDQINLVTLLIGANDYAGSITIGQFSDIANTSTFYGKLKHFVELINNANSQTKIILLTPTKANGQSVFYDQANSSGYYLEDYAQAIARVAYEYSLPCIDLYANSGFNATTIPDLTSDLLHPNDIGMQKIADFFAKSVYNSNTKGYFSKIQIPTSTTSNLSTPYVPYWDGTEFQNSIMRQNGTTINIGTSSTNRVRLHQGGVIEWGSSGSHGILSWDGTGAIVGSRQGKELEFHSDNSLKGKFTTNGDFILSETNNVAKAKLDIDGDLYIGSSSTITNATQSYVLDPTTGKVAIQNIGQGLNGIFNNSNEGDTIAINVANTNDDFQINANSINNVSITGLDYQNKSISVGVSNDVNGIRGPKIMLDSSFIGFASSNITGENFYQNISRNGKWYLSSSLINTGIEPGSLFVLDTTSVNISDTNTTNIVRSTPYKFPLNSTGSGFYNLSFDNNNNVTFSPIETQKHYFSIPHSSPTQQIQEGIKGYHVTIPEELNGKSITNINATTVTEQNSPDGLPMEVRMEVIRNGGIQANSTIFITNGNSSSQTAVTIPLEAQDIIYLNCISNPSAKGLSATITIK